MKDYFSPCPAQKYSSNSYHNLVAVSLGFMQEEQYIDEKNGITLFNKINVIKNNNVFRFIENFPIGLTRKKK